MKEIDKERIEALVRLIPGDYAVYSWQDRLHTLFHSPHAWNLSGYTAEEWQRQAGDDSLSMIYEKDRPAVRERIEKCLQGGEGEAIYRIYHKEKGLVWLHTRIRLAGTLQGLPVFIAVFMNISHEWNRHEALLDHTNRRIFVVDRHTREMLYGNTVAVQRGHGTYTGQTCYHYFWGRQEPCPWCRLEWGKNGPYKDTWYDREEKRWLEISGQWITWGGREAYAEFTEDVTERALTEHLLATKAAGIETILQHVPAGISVLQQQETGITIAAANPCFLRLFGIESFEKGALWEHVLYPLIHEEDRYKVLTLLERLFTRDEQGECLCRMKCGRTGPYRWIRWQGRSVREGALLAYITYTDADDERKALEGLQYSQEQYRSAIEGAELLVWEYDLRSRQVVMPPYAVLTWGLPAVLDNVPQSLLPYVSERSQAAFLQMYKDMDAGVQKISQDIWFELPGQGERQCKRIIYHVLKDRQGRPSKAYGIGQDITARQHQEENYNQFLSRLLDVHPQAVNVFSLNLTRNQCIQGKKRTAHMLWAQDAGSVDGFFEGAFWFMPDPGDLQRARALLSRHTLLDTFRQGQAHVSLEYRFRWSDGIVRWTLSQLHMAQNPRTGDIEALIYSFDIDDAVKRQHVVRHLTKEEYDFLALIQVDQRRIVFSYRSELLAQILPGQYIDYDRSMQTVLQQVASREEADFCSRSLSLDQVIAQLQEKSSYSFRFYAGGADKRQYRKCIKYMYLDEEKSAILAVLSDETREYRQEQRKMGRLQMALSIAERANEEKSRFLSDMSHTMRTPLNGIMGFTALAVQAGADEAHRTQLDYFLKRIASSGQLLLATINDTLELSRLESRKASLMLSSTALPGLLQEAVGKALSATSGHVALQLQVTGKLPAYVEADEEKLRKILSGILDHILYSAPLGSVAELRAVYDWKNHMLKLYASRGGNSLSLAAEQRIFEPFSQDSYGKGPQEGTGLGLAIALALVQLMEGTLRAGHRGRQGLCFTAGLPLAPAKGHRPYGALNPATLAGRKILLCEDNEINRELVSLMLQKKGMTVLSAANGREGIDVFSSSPIGDIDLILMDMYMPVMDGREATEAIRNMLRPDAAAVPVIAMTGEAGDILQLVKGLNGYVQKPFQPEQLFQVLSKYLS